MKNAAAEVVMMPATTKVLPCAKCKRDVLASNRTILVFCKDCSAAMGVKR